MDFSWGSIKLLLDLTYNKTSDLQHRNTSRQTRCLLIYHISKLIVLREKLYGIPREHIDKNAHFVVFNFLT